MSSSLIYREVSATTKKQITVDFHTQVITSHLDQLKTKSNPFGRPCKTPLCLCFTFLPITSSHYKHDFDSDSNTFSLSA